jgi:2-octaprenyl-6-methoxyphenol hydroxylase
MRLNEQFFDVVISGGGLSGSLMALSLALFKKSDGEPLSIAVVEAVDKKDNKASNQELTQISVKSNVFDQRVLALSHGSSQYLEQLGIWEDLAPHACPIKEIDISDRGNYGKARINAKKHHVDALGYVIEMALIGNALQKKLKQYKHVNYYFGQTITKVDWTEENAQPPINSKQKKQSICMTLASGEQLCTRLLLGCDGLNSPSRKQANIKVKSSDYKQMALIANVATSLPHQNKAYERFTTQGPIAMLPLLSLKGENRCSLVWTLNPDSAKKIASLNDADFKKSLEQAFGYWLGGITQVGERVAFPLTLVQAEQQTYHRMALIGNASHTIHPIAGQGFNLGLRDVKYMAELIKMAVDTNQDIGSFSLLHRYEKQRNKDHHEVISLTDSLVTLFSNELPPLVAGRNIGLKALNYLSPLKHKLVIKTMGY